jgi:AAA family ATP:ADP antiporter
MTDAAKENPFKRIIKATTKIEPNELKATVLSFLFVFSLMSAYMIIRPVRDAMASDWSRVETSWLWTATFFFSVIAVSVYGLILSRVRFSRVVPGAYVFFAITFAAFYFGSQFIADSTVVDKTFYVWLSVFSLFHMSVFWSFMSGLFSKEQAPRLFAIIGTGASLGGIVGSYITGYFAKEIGVMNLMLISSVVLLIPLPLIGALENLKVSELGNKDVQADLGRAKRLGKNPFAGFLLFIKNPYLLAIGLFILMYVAMNTFIYMELREMLAAYERPERAEILGRIDFWVNVSTIVIAFFVTGRIATRFGMATTLALVPFLMIGGWMIVAAVPFLAVLIILQGARKTGNYAITRPGREMLFTLVDNETRYKAKPVIDIVVYRGGDMAMAWFHTLLRELFAFGLGGVAVVAAVIAAVWAMMGVYLGRTYNKALDEDVREAQTSQ